MTDRRKALLELYPVLARIPGEELDRAMEASRTVVLKAGSVAFEELQDCVAYPFILEGCIRVAKRSAESGREISLYRVEPGDACVVSAACLLGTKPYNAIGLVQSDCELVMMPRRDFDRLMSIASFREFVFSLFSKRVIDLMQLVDEVVFSRLDQRLARLLLGRGPVLGISHQRLADELGTVREMVTRILNGFADRRLVRMGRGEIEVLDASGLERLCGG